MADALYRNYKAILWGGGVHGAVDWDADTIKVALTDHAGADGAPAPATDQDYEDINGSTIGTPQTLTSVTIDTVAEGTVDAADPTFTAVSGDSIESYSYYKDTGTPTTSPLLIYIDQATGLPLTPNGGDITITHNASGIVDI